MRILSVTLCLLAGCVDLARPEQLRDWTSGNSDGEAGGADGVRGGRDGGPPADHQPAEAGSGEGAVPGYPPRDADPGDTTPPDTSPVSVDVAAPEVAQPDRPPPDVGLPPDAPAVPPAGTPTLHWRFDELAGTVASDASGNGYHGSYYGLAGSLPSTSSIVPSVQFANPASRAFAVASRHQVRLYNPPAALMPANAVTATAWFRTSRIDGDYSVILQAADGYIITLGQAQILADRGVSTSRHEACTASVTGLLDGQWHHVAAVFAPTGTKLYLDGTERCTNSRGDNLVYDSGLGILVGRRSSSSPFQFEGNIDDIRVYTRVLSAAQIQNLARGAE